MLSGQGVTVIGAGIAGLAVATVMARHGAKVRVLERSPAVAKAGAGLQISPNGLAVLAALGLGGAVRLAGRKSHAVELKDYRSGRRVLRIDLTGRQSLHPFVLIRRTCLINLLEKAARGAGVELTLGVSADPRSVTGPLVIGADGIRSTTRQLLNGPEAPAFSGQVAWRAMIADDAVPEAHVWMGPGRHLVTYPVASGLRNLVAVEERNQWVGEDWDQADDPARLRTAFTEFAPEVRHWLAKVDAVRIWGLFRHDVAARWQDGRFVILGDAAHPTLPFLAQGANLALEDAWILGQCLNRLPQKEALAEFQRRRRSRAVRAVTAAAANARNFHLRNPLVRGVAHNALRIGGALLPHAALNRLEWLYGFDATRE